MPENNDELNNVFWHSYSFPRQIQKQSYKLFYYSSAKFVILWNNKLTEKNVVWRDLCETGVEL